MPTFLTDEEMAKLEAEEQAKGKFISDEEMAALEAQETATPKTSPLEAGVMGAAQGASLGFVDELAGGLEALGSKVGLRGLGGSLSDIRLETPEEDALSFADVYKQGRDLRRGEYERAAQENPASFTGGKILGGIASGVAVPSAATANLARAASIGAGIGAATGFGESQGETSNQILDTLRGATVGGGLGAAGAAITKAMTPAAKAAQEQAARSAYRVTGGLKSDINKLYNQTPEEIGQELLDRGLITLGTKRGSRELSEKILEDLGRFRTGQDKLMSTLDEGAPNAFDVTKVIAKIRKSADEYRNMAGSGNQSYAKALDDEADILSNLYKENPNISLSDALALKRNFDQGGKFQSPLSEAFKVEASRTARSAVNREIDDIISKIVNPDVAAAYNQSRQGASRLLSAKSALDQAQMREQANKTFGLTDLLSGGAGATIGSVAGGPAALAGIAGGIAANKAVSNYGASTTALGLQKAAQVLGNKGNQQALSKYSATLGGQLAGQNAEQPQPVVKSGIDLQQRIQNMPPQYRAVFDRAVQKGGNAAAVMHHTLFTKDPEYRRLMQEMDEQQE